MKEFFASVATTVFIVAIILAVLAGVGYAYQKMTGPYLVDWVANLPADPVEADKEFSARVNKKFPISANESALIEVLHASKFVPSWPDKDGYNTASLIYSDFSCKYERLISWKSDKEGLISDITGKYFQTCD